MSLSDRFITVCPRIPGTSLMPTNSSSSADEYAMSEPGYGLTAAATNSITGETLKTSVTYGNRWIR